MPSCTVVIPTFDRLRFWRDEGRLLPRLYSQSDPDFELIVVDDNSPDDTAEWLARYFTVNPPPFLARVLRSTRPRTSEYQASAWADNIAFREATGDVLLHLDDDLAISNNIVGYVKRLGAEAGRGCYYGLLKFTDDQWRVLPGKTGIDSRWREEFALAADGNGVVPMSQERRGEWGAVFAVATAAVRAIGGHNLDLLGYRGSDSCIGRRLLLHGLSSYFCIHPDIVTLHYGNSWFKQMKLAGDTEAIAARSMSPHVNMESGCIEVVANGGLDFWQSSAFDDTYEVVYE